VFAHNSTMIVYKNKPATQLYKLKTQDLFCIQLHFEMNDIPFLFFSFFL